MKGKVAKMDDS